MSKAREAKPENFEEVKLTSGVTLRIAPFPAQLYNKLTTKAFEDFPDPPVPRKTVKTFDGEEETDDPENPQYLKDKKKARDARNNLLAEAVFDLCVEVVDFEKWQPKIKRLEKYTGSFPDDPDDCRIEFLQRYALRTKGDYELVMISATSQMMTSDKEVQARLKIFQSDVERAVTADAAAPGPDERQRLAVESAANGT